MNGNGEHLNLQGDTIHSVGLTSLPSSVFLLCATTLGAGLLLIPSTFAEVGFGLGFISLFVFGFLTWFSIYMLLKSADHLGVRSYEELVALAFPSVPWLGRFITMLFMNVLIFGALTGFVDIIGDVTMPLILHIPVSHQSFWVQEYFVVPVLVTVIILPLCLLRRISFLEYSSYLAVGIIIFFSGLITYLGIAAIAEHKIPWNSLRLFDVNYEMVFSALPVISLAYTCQLTVFPIWKELYNPVIDRMNLVVVFMTFISFTLYATVGFFGYILYRSSVQGQNVINLLINNAFYDVIRAIFGVAILCHYPVVHFAFRNSIELTFFSQWQFSWFRHIIITVLTVAVTTFLALKEDLSNVFDLTGSFAAFPICFIIPSVVYLKVMVFSNGIRNEELDPLLKEPQYRRGTPLSRMFSLPAILAVLTLVITTICCGISIYVSILELIPKKN